MHDFQTVAEKHIGVGDVKDYRFVIGTKQLDLTDETRFNAMKHFIVNGATIFVLQRMLGGSEWMEISKLIEKIQTQLPAELINLQKLNKKCIICRDTTQCMKLHCKYICEDCFRIYYKTTNYNLKCPKCHEKVTPDTFFHSTSFRQLINKLQASKDLLQHIDCQICTCGVLLNNETMWSRQTCNSCSRTLCFFCNKDWDSNKMRNAQYTCGYNCDYETKITFELVPCLEFDPRLMIPNRRCCPKCYYLGAFGEQCKYHKCFACGYRFCFLCLKSEEECKQKYSQNRLDSAHRTECEKPKAQKYSMFPRLNNYRSQ